MLPSGSIFSDSEFKRKNSILLELCSFITNNAYWKIIAAKYENRQFGLNTKYKSKGRSFLREYGVNMVFLIDFCNEGLVDLLSSIIWNVGPVLEWSSSSELRTVGGEPPW